MNRRELLAGAALLAGTGQANAWGVGKLGRGLGRGGALGGSKVASLSLNFATGAYSRNSTTYPDFATFLSSTGSTFTRASANATYINVSGVLTTASTDAARFNYDANYPRGGAAPSLTGPFLLIEPAATNLALQSNNYAASWFPTGSSVATSAQFTSPDGTNNGWDITSGIGFGAQGQAFTVSAIQYTASIWAVRRTGTPPLQLYVNGTNTGNITTSATITRYPATITPSAGAGNNLVVVNAASGTSLGTFGYQFETGAVATSYIVTTTGTATRATDAFTIAVPAGLSTLTITFDDNSTQIIGSASGNYLLTTSINRPNIKRMLWS